MLTNKRKEKISAFLDDEMFRDEIMSFSLSSEPEDAEVAQRYQLMGDSLRGEMSELSFIDVSQAVHEALLDENLAVEKSAAEKPVIDRHLVNSHAEPAGRISTSKTGFFASSAWFRPVAGMAMAVLVALVLVVSLSEQENSNHAPVVNNIEQQPAVQLAIENSAGKNRTGGNIAGENKPVGKKATDLNPYLVNQHLEFATQDTLQGRLPYVRAVSYQNKNKR